MANLNFYFKKWLKKSCGFSDFLGKKVFGQVVPLVHWRDFHLYVIQKVSMKLQFTITRCPKQGLNIHLVNHNLKP